MCSRVQVKTLNWGADCNASLRGINSRSFSSSGRQALCERKRASSRPQFLARCQCFKCPAGFTSQGGALGSPCTPVVQSTSLAFISTEPCSEAQLRALEAFYRAKLEAVTNIIRSSVKVVATCRPLAVSQIRAALTLYKT